jgi:hypothetical protein
MEEHASRASAPATRDAFETEQVTDEWWQAFLRAERSHDGDSQRSRVRTHTPTPEGSPGFLDTSEEHHVLCDHVFRLLSNACLVNVMRVSKSWRAAALLTGSRYRPFSVGVEGLAPTMQNVCTPVHPRSGGESGDGDGVAAAAPCLLATARWVANVLEGRFPVAAFSPRARRECERRRALLIPDSAPEMLLRWRRGRLSGEESDSDDGEDGDDDATLVRGGPPVTSFWEVSMCMGIWRTPKGKGVGNPTHEASYLNSNG